MKKYQERVLGRFWLKVGLGKNLQDENMFDFYIFL